MLCKRIIGAILVEGDKVVRRVGFKTRAIIGDVDVTIRYLQNWGIDEILIINVCEDDGFSDVVKRVTEKCFLPITVGGSISTFEEAANYIRSGADKIVLGKHKSKDLCNSIAEVFGGQAVTVSIDEDHANVIREVNRWDAGEIILHDKNRDGLGSGLNLEILKLDSRKPRIAMGGVGNYDHIVSGLDLCDGVAVGNLFHFKELSAKQAKEKALEKNIKIRKVL